MLHVRLGLSSCVTMRGGREPNHTILLKLYHIGPQKRLACKFTPQVSLSTLRSTCYGTCFQLVAFATPHELFQRVFGNICTYIVCTPYMVCTICSTSLIKEKGPLQASRQTLMHTGNNAAPCLCNFNVVLRL